MLYRQIVAADLQVTNEIHWYSFSFVLKIILWSIIQYKFENGWLYFSVHLHMTPTSRCLFPPFLPFEWRFMHLHLGVVDRWLVERPLQPDPYFQLSQHNYPIDSLSTVSLIFPSRSTCINTYLFVCLHQLLKLCDTRNNSILNFLFYFVKHVQADITLDVNMELVKNWWKCNCTIKN